MTVAAGAEGTNDPIEVGKHSPRGSEVLASMTRKALTSAIDGGYGDVTDRTETGFVLDTTYTDDPVALADALRNLRDTHQRL